ncbi:hypothetical protein NDU88_004213 [Pleurodeles waltl]|uniref:Uncharacterized protein n=1 Tax=Pleurodeles waltl TaxID=8319 RepID=A0AAV7QBA3_PLEWA|nr:hypothetical protein NDU88_004213 [Pleurodeles waltl]
MRRRVAVSCRRGRFGPFSYESPAARVSNCLRRRFFSPTTPLTGSIPNSYGGGQRPLSSEEEEVAAGTGEAHSRWDTAARLHLLKMEAIAVEYCQLVVLEEKGEEASTAASGHQLERH